MLACSYLKIKWIKWDNFLIKAVSAPATADFPRCFFLSKKKHPKRRQTFVTLDLSVVQTRLAPELLQKHAFVACFFPQTILAPQAA